MKINNPDDIRNLLKRQPGYASVRVAVETGLFRAATALVCAPVFDVYHGIEINPGHVRLCRRRLSEAGIAHVSIHEGDTRFILPKLAESIKEPALFMLDAHYSFVRRGKIFEDEADMVHGPEGADFPLLFELQILSARPYADIVLVDDTALFGKDMAVLKAPDTKGNPGNVSPQWEVMSHTLVERTLGRVIRREDWRGSTIYWRKGDR